MPRFYELQVWKKVRRLQLADEPLCEQCRREGRWTRATIADHVKPIAQGGALLDLANLQSLCQQCHSRKTTREQGWTDRPGKGATADGLPTDPGHPWHRGASKS